MNKTKITKCIKGRISLVLTICALSFFLYSPALYSSETLEAFYPAKVKDISDRAYEPAVIDLLDNAKESIVISMYILKAEEKGPVSLLVNDLAEALDRGVSVEIYLNTRFNSRGYAKALKSKPLQMVREKGAEIFRYNSAERVHDKLIIVDSRFVVEGSPNWSVSALKNNYESATLIDSPRLAQVKLKRLRDIPLVGESPRNTKELYIPKRIGMVGRGESVEFKKVLLEDKNLFPRMVKAHGNRSMDTYLLLTAESGIRQSPEKGNNLMTVSLEDIAFTLKMPEEWPRSTKRRQIIKTLRKLKNKYKLIDFSLRYGKDARIELVDLPGDTFSVSSIFFAGDSLIKRSTSGNFVLLVEELLKAEGKALDSFSLEDLIKRFHVKRWGLQSGFKEIKE